MFEGSFFGYDAKYNMGYFIDTSAPVTEYDMLNMIYKDAGNPLTSVKDTAKAQEIADKTVSQYIQLRGDLVQKQNRETTFVISLSVA